MEQAQLGRKTRRKHGCSYARGAGCVQGSSSASVLLSELLPERPLSFRRRKFARRASARLASLEPGGGFRVFCVITE